LLPPAHHAPLHSRAINAKIVDNAGIRGSKIYLMANIRRQKLLQLDIERELEGLTFEELVEIAMLINKFYSKNILNVFNYLK
jgi:radical SAM superfamily enzyme